MSEGRSLPGFTDSYTMFVGSNISNKMLKLINARGIVNLSVPHRIGNDPITVDPHSYQYNIAEVIENYLGED